jgi:hypothetical protein
VGGVSDQKAAPAFGPKSRSHSDAHAPMTDAADVDRDIFTDQSCEQGDTSALVKVFGSLIRREKGDLRHELAALKRMGHQNAHGGAGVDEVQHCRKAPAKEVGQPGTEEINVHEMLQRAGPTDEPNAQATSY